MECFLDKPKFFVLPYAKRRYWSKEKENYVENDFMPAQVWSHEGIPLKGYLCDVDGLINILKNKYDGKKEHRPVVSFFETDEFPIKERCGLDKWSGIIKVDLDNGKSPLINKMSRDDVLRLYDHLDFALQKLCPDHYMYIEESSTSPGFHLLFYFNCERNEKNFDICAQYVYELFRYRLDDYIKNFSHIFTMPECLKSSGRSEVFDDVYKRPYTKFYMTGKNYRVYNCSGHMDDVELKDNDHHVEKKVEKNADNSFFDISFNGGKKYDLDHNDRFYIITSLKKYCRDRETAYKLWYDFCPHIKEYKKYKVRDFINQFEREYDNAKPEAGHISVLKRYGFKMNEDVVHFILKKDQYLGDIYDDVLSECVNGINLLVVPTGGGKTQAPINFYKKLKDDPMSYNNGSILIIEPMNSIIDSKYDYDATLVNYSKRLEINMLYNQNMIVTNYNHLLMKNEDGYCLREDIDDIFKRCDLIIVDESHIMLKDIFRSDVLIEFMELLNKHAECSKIIIQTATPMLEKALLNIKREIIVEKPLNKKVKYIFREAEDDFFITDVICLCRYYLNNGRKVYVYWNNGSLQNMNIFRNIYGDDMIVYHKKNNGSDEMVDLNNDHVVGDKDLLMSSVYFGVGNDLNDDGAAAVIIIGNNVVQEDVQADGRWRNSKDIEVCVVMRKWEADDFMATMDSYDNVDKLIKNRENYYKAIWHDKYNRDKSVIVNGKSFKLRKEYYCRYLGIMEAAGLYFKQGKIKIDYLERLGYDVRKNIKPLLVNREWMEQLEDLKEANRSHRNLIIRKLLNGEECYDERNKNNKINRVAKVIKRLRDNGLLKYISNLNKSTYSSLIKYETYIRFYMKNKYDKSDYAELYSILWFRDHVDKYKGRKYKVQGFDISGEDYCLLCSYLMWLVYRNKNDRKMMMRLDYFYDFKDVCYDMLIAGNVLIGKIFERQGIDVNVDDFYNEFFGDNVLMRKEDDNVSIDNLFENIDRIDLDEEYIKKVVFYIVSIMDEQGKRKEQRKEAGKIGGKNGSPKKRIKDLKTGIIYDSCDECCKALGKALNYISRNKDRFIRM